MRPAHVFALAFVAIACGAKEPASSPGSSAPTEARAPAVADPAPAPASSAAPEPKKRKPYEITNHCSEVVAIGFGEDGKSGQRTLTSGSSIEGPRDAEGNQTIWLLDKDQPLVKVHVTRGMSRVEVGKSCRTLDAR